MFELRLPMQCYTGKQETHGLHFVRGQLNNHHIWIDPHEPEPGTASRFVAADVKVPSLAWTCCCNSSIAETTACTTGSPDCPRQATVPPSVPSMSYRRRHAPTLHPGGIRGADKTSLVFSFPPRVRPTPLSSSPNSKPTVS